MLQQVATLRIFHQAMWAWMLDTQMMVVDVFLQFSVGVKSSVTFVARKSLQIEMHNLTMNSQISPMIESFATSFAFVIPNVLMICPDMGQQA